MFRKGIILAGGTGSRLYPLTRVVCKQLLPIYDKPMIYYPLSTLMLAGIREIMVISSSETLPLMQGLLGDGRALGLRFTYREQPRPEGIAQSIVIAQDFIDGAPFALILGDNIFYGNETLSMLARIAAASDRNTIFGYKVKDPENFGVVTLDADRRPVRIEEKPSRPASHWAVPGLYFYTPEAIEIARNLKPSARGELEISDVNKALCAAGHLQVELLGRGNAWLDCGTPEALLDASEFIRVIEQRAGLKVSCPEEIAFRMGFIDRDQLAALGQAHGESAYGRYLRGLLDE
ncbi:MAG: glucose-1-phosphate thymidylyltransferase RfbA [Alphaproteobacteria bacterium]